MSCCWVNIYQEVKMFKAWNVNVLNNMVQGHHNFVAQRNRSRKFVLIDKSNWNNECFD